MIFSYIDLKSWNARDELNEIGLHCGQWTTSKPGSTVASKLMFVLSKDEKDHFPRFLKTSNSLMVLRRT